MFTLSSLTWDIDKMLGKRKLQRFCNAIILYGAFISLKFAHSKLLVLYI